MKKRLLLIGLALMPALGALAKSDVKVSGEVKQWHRVTFTFTGPETGEQAKLNPFRDYRLNVSFTQADTTINVPGYYAADGKAGETGADKGNRWKVHFCPPQIGVWHYKASFRQGKDIAVSHVPKAGKAVSFNGRSGAFNVLASDKKANDFRRQGMLRYIGRHYYRFAGSRRPYLKSGADSPENFLGYKEFDQTPNGKHLYRPHLRDWKKGDPTWRGGRGKGIIGAINYLSSKQVNSLYFITMNVQGDGKDVWPWTSINERHRFDCSKLDQWETVFNHMTAKGVALHVLTQEQENDQLLDDGELGRQRKLYYRELIARFAHHPALVWNLGEENTNTDKQRKQFANFIRNLDPYNHPIVCHTFPKKQDQVYTPLLGFPKFEGTSLQTNDTHPQTKKWVDLSRHAGRPWVVTLDEIGPANIGVKPDKDDPTHDEVRRKHLWGNLMAGGAGCEWYFGYKYPHNDLNCEDFRSRDKLWDMSAHAVNFFRYFLPFPEMRHADGLTEAPNDYCFAKPGEIYAVYLPEGGTTNIELPAASYQIEWYDPRNGGYPVPGKPAVVSGPGKVSLGRPHKDPEQDWAVVLRLISPPPEDPGQNK
ncbi:MAG: DUF5060 domain-containing protein [Verrucomicrobiota bacterium]